MAGRTAPPGSTTTGTAVSLPPQYAALNTASQPNAGIEKYLDDAYQQTGHIPNGWEDVAGHLARQEPGFLYRHPWIFPLLGVSAGLALGPSAGGGAATALGPSTAGNMAETSAIAGGSGVPTSLAATGGAIKVATGIPWGKAFDAGANLFGNLYGAHQTTDAAERAAQIQADALKYGADKQTDASLRSEAWLRQQAQNDWQNQELTRRANYDQWASQEQRHGSIRSLFGLPTGAMPGYAPSRDPHYTSGGSQLPRDAAGGPSTGGPSAGAPGTGAAMPPGIDPDFAKLYQKYGVTPSGRGSGPPDWQYYQQDAMRNAGGDKGYVLGRLEADLQGGASGAPQAARPGAAPGAIGNWNAPLTGSLSPTTGYGIGGY